MKKIYYFRAQKQTNRFNKNQKVWIRHLYNNHLALYYKWRGSGRYVRGIIDILNPSVGEIKQVEVDDEFADRISKRPG